MKMEMLKQEEKFKSPLEIYQSLNMRKYKDKIKNSCKKNSKIQDWKQKG